MKRFLIGALTAGAVASVALLATNAFFSDTETSTGNTFIAGKLDLKVDDSCSYNGLYCIYDPRGGGNSYWSNCQTPAPACSNEGPCSCGWIEKDLTTGDIFFNYADVKPGDIGENTISLKAVDNDAWLCAYVKNLANNDNGLTEPESIVDSTGGVGQGELQNAIHMKIWRDTDCNNIPGANEQVLVQDAAIDSNSGVWPLYAPALAGGPLPGDTKTCLGVQWSVPAGTGNEIQTDSVSGDIAFYVEQFRNNPNFVCPGIPTLFP